MPSLDFHAVLTNFGRHIDLFIVGAKHPDDASSTRIVGQPLLFQVQDEGALNPEPTIRMRPTEAQALMDHLWRIGLRPSEGSGSAGALAATERHLADMRKIALDLLKGPA